MSNHTGLCIGLREGKEVFFRAAADVIEEQDSHLTAAEKENTEHKRVRYENRKYFDKTCQEYSDRIKELESKVRACENTATGDSQMAIEDDARIKKLEGALEKIERLAIKNLGENPIYCYPTTDIKEIATEALKGGE